MTKKITQQEYLSILGLMTLAREAGKTVNKCDKTMNDIIGEEFSLLSNEIWEERDVASILKDMKIEVED